MAPGDKLPAGPQSSPPAPPETGRAPEKPKETEAERTAREAEERKKAELMAIEERARAAREVAKNGLPEGSPAVPVSSVEQPAAPAEEKKPEGWMAQTGQTLKEGAEKVGGWLKQFWGWTEKNAGSGWKHLVEGITAAAAAVGSAFSWLREKSAHLFGSLAASVDEYLPDWIKKPLNFLMGDYGVLYKNFTKFKIEVLPTQPNQELSLKPFMEKFEMIAVTGQTVSFDEYCRLVALKLRENPTNRTVIPLKVTQLQLEQAADQVVAQRLAMPATPAATPTAVPGSAPGVAPAAAVAVAPAAAAAGPGVKPPEGQVAPPDIFTFETIPVGTSLLEVPRKLRFEGRDMTVSASKDGTIKIDTITYKLKVSKFVGVWGVGATIWVPPSIEKLEWQADGLHCTGSFVFSESQVLPRNLLEDFLRKHMNGDRSFENEKVSLKRV